MHSTLDDKAKFLPAGQSLVLSFLQNKRLLFSNEAPQVGPGVQINTVYFSVFKGTYF